MLNSNTLYNGFVSLMDSNNFTENLMSVSQKWSSVFENFYLEMMMPIPGFSNPNLYPSLYIFKSELLASIKLQSVYTTLELIITKLHLGVCNGVNMSGIYTTTFPVVPLVLKPCFSSKFTIEKVATLLSNTIFLWVSSTFSVQNSSGAIVKWV